LIEVFHLIFTLNDIYFCKYIELVFYVTTRQFVAYNDRSEFLYDIKIDTNPFLKGRNSLNIW